MALLLFVFMPLLLVNLTAGIASRRRPSFPLFVFQGLIGVCASLAVSLFFLLPQERMQLSSANGMLHLTFGKSAIFLCLLLDLFVGVLLGMLLREESDSLPVRRHRTPAYLLLFFFLFVLLFLTQGYFWGRTVYGNTTLDQIIFYLNMPLEGTAFGFTQSILHSILVPVLLIFFPVLWLCVYPAKHPHSMIFLRRIRLPLFPMHLPLRSAYSLLVLWLAVLLIHSNSMLRIDAFISSLVHASSFIEENYVDPTSVSIAFPERKRNLITVYLESYETTPQDIASGGVLDVNLIPEMTQIARENISFSRNEQITGAAVPARCAWTMGALVAQSAGLPLMYFSNQDGSNANTLLPGAVTMGEILRQQGYNLMFMAGSDFTFGGRRAYYRTHGDYQVWDLLCAYEEERIPPDYYEGWGFEDAKLYAYAKEKLLDLAAQDAPFHFAMLSVDTHTPGFRCALCPADYQSKGADAFNYADVLRCSSMQFASFLSWCQQQPFYENTTIIVTGDHQSMQDFFYRNMLGSVDAANQTAHYVYNAFINPAIEPVQATNRLFTTMDFFPSALASLGVKIEGDRLGLGTNLFSARETLSEQYGEDALFAELEKKSIFYEEHLLYPSQEP